MPELSVLWRGVLCHMPAVELVVNEVPGPDRETARRDLFAIVASQNRVAIRSSSGIWLRNNAAVHVTRKCGVVRGRIALLGHHASVCAELAAGEGAEASMSANAAAPAFPSWLCGRAGWAGPDGAAAHVQCRADATCIAKTLC